jgi:hypothetical protein
MGIPIDRADKISESNPERGCRTLLPGVGNRGWIDGAS